MPLKDFDDFLSNFENATRKMYCLMAKVLDYNIVASDFELQSSYNVHFRTDTPWKSINSLILSAMG